jgi:hypothetical protein
MRRGPWVAVTVLGWWGWCADVEAHSCKNWALPERIGLLEEPAVHESSGLAKSWSSPSIWYTHNDSGTGPEIYSFRLDGTFLGTSKVLGAQSIDWEGMAAGPCPGDSDQGCIYIGDIGDNDKKRSDVQIYAIPEPHPGEPVEVLSSWSLLYPGEVYDAEALLVHPLTGEITLISKRKSGKSHVFVVPPTPGPQDQRMTQVARVTIEGAHSNFRKITGGEWSQDGLHIVLRSYGPALIWSVDPCAPLAHWSREPDTVLVGVTAQGEAISFDGPQSLIVTSEGSPMPIITTRCTDWQPAITEDCRMD